MEPSGLQGDGIRILCDGPEIFEAFLNAVGRARKKVAVNFYIFSESEIGRKVLTALSAAADRGCEVRVLIDGMGSFFTNLGFFSPLLRSGGKVLIHKPLAPWQARWGWSRRDHRKMLLVDGDCMLVGGFNISDPYFLPVERGGYHDLGVEVRGPVCEEPWFLFERAWRRAGGAMRKTGFFSGIGWHSRMEEAFSRATVVLWNDHLRNRWLIRRSILDAVAKAAESVDIINPYFLPDGGMIAAFIRAKERGVRVRVIVPRESDVRIADLASLIAQERLAKRGIEIYHWPGVAHAKAVLVDGAWFSVGSYNLDSLSLFYNLEIVVNASDPSAAWRLKEILDGDVGKSARMEKEAWARLPWRTRFLSRLLYRFRSFL